LRSLSMPFGKIKFPTTCCYDKLPETPETLMGVAGNLGVA
jgi:hypothetical protein